MVDVVVFDGIAGRLAGPGVSPDPTHADTGIVEMVNMIVRYRVGPTVPHPDADRTGEHQSAAVDLTVRDRVMMAVLVELHTPGPEVGQRTPGDHTVLAARTKL